MTIQSDYGLSLVTGPALEPVSLIEAKSHLRIDASTTDYDAEITAWIIAARRWAEGHTGRPIGQQTWKLTLDTWPGQCDRWGPGRWESLPYRDAILLPKPPVTAVSSIEYVDVDGVTQTLAANQYIARLDTVPARIVPAYGVTWPDLRGDEGGVRVTFVCGEPASETTKAAIKMIVGHFDKNREATGADADLAPVVGRLLDMEFSGLLYGAK